MRCPSSVIRSAWLDKLPQKDGTILDIGANIGLTSIYLSKKHPEKKIFAIEPDLSNSGLLLLNVSGIANMTPRNFAIWGDRVDSLFIPPSTSEWGRQTHTDKSNDSQEVKAIRVDDFMAAHRINNISILKMDVEGAEFNIFSKNPQPWLKKVESIVIELHESMARGCTKAFSDSIAADFHPVATTSELVLGARR